MKKERIRFRERLEVAVESVRKAHEVFEQEFNRLGTAHYRKIRDRSGKNLKRLENLLHKANKTIEV